jgi:hypothetical protein
MEGKKKESHVNLLVDVDGTIEVGGFITWSRTTGARVPVVRVDLEDTNIERTVAVVVGGVGVTGALVRNDTLAARLRPTILGANVGDANVAGRRSTRARGTVSRRTVSLQS